MSGQPRGKSGSISPRRSCVMARFTAPGFWGRPAAATTNMCATPTPRKARTRRSARIIRRMRIPTTRRSGGADRGYCASTGMGPKAAVATTICITGKARAVRDRGRGAPRMPQEPLIVPSRRGGRSISGTSPATWTWSIGIRITRTSCITRRMWWPRRPAACRPP